MHTFLSYVDGDTLPYIIGGSATGGVVLLLLLVVVILVVFVHIARKGRKMNAPAEQEK